MKAVLLLCLLAFMTCEKDIIDIGKCIYKAPKVQELIGDVIAAIVNQDFSKLLPKLKEALLELVKIVLGCIINTNAVEEQPKLKMTFEAYMKYARPDIYNACLSLCSEQASDSRCLRNCLAQSVQSKNK